MGKPGGDFMVELYDTGHSPHGVFRGEICTGNIEEMLKKKYLDIDTK